MGHKVTALEVAAAVLIAGGAILMIVKSRMGPAQAGPGRQAPGFGEKHYDRGGLTKQHWQETLTLEKETTGRNEKSVRQFIQNITIAGIWHHLIALGFDPTGPAAVMLHETGYGLSLAAREYDNLLGISYTDKSTKPYTDRPFKFDSVPHCLEYFDTMMHWSLYAQAAGFKKHPDSFVRALHEAGFNSSDSWLSGVQSAVQKIKAVLPK